MANAANFTQYMTPGGMDNEVFTQAQAAYDSNDFDALARIVSYAETEPRDVICDQFRKAHGTQKAETTLNVTFL